MKNFLCDDLPGKEGYGYDSGCQYCGSSGTGHRSCDHIYSLLGGITTSGLTQSQKETYTGWEDIVGNIYTGGFFGYVIYIQYEFIIILVS